MSTLDATLDQNSARSGSSPTGSMADSQHQHQHQHQHQRGAKRLRLSVACNRCRARKVRCDASLPKCRNCIARNEVCETTDLRNPGGPAPAVRQLAPSKADRVLGVVEGTVDQEPDPNLNPRSTPFVAADTNTAAAAVESSGQPATAPHNSDFVATGLAPRTRTRSGRGSVSHSRKTKHPQSAAQFTPNKNTVSWLQRAYNANATVDSPPDGNNANTAPVVDGPSPDVVVNTDGTPHRVKFMGGSSLQCLCRFVDLHLTRRGLKPASTQFKHGMQRSEEFDLPLHPELPDLPPPAELEQHLDVFFDRLWPIFPVVDRSTVQAGIDRLLTLQLALPGTRLSDHVTAKSATTLAIVYAILCIAADEINGRISDTGVRYLTAAYGLYAHLIASPHLESVQAMFLLSLALRGENRDGQAWHIIGHTIRTSHSIGLHQHINDLSTAQEGYDTNLSNIKSLRKRVWWSCFALEKLMQLESGRPSVINDLDDNEQRQPNSSSRNSSYAESANGGSAGGQDHFTAWIALAQIIGRICHHIYCRKSVSSWHLLNETARLDQALSDWERSLPDSLRLSNISGSESFVGHHDPLRQHLSGFIWQQFCHAQIALLRAALVFPQTSYEHEVTKHADALPSAPRLLNSANLCADAARKAITTVMYLADNGIHSVLLGPNPPFLGAIVLALCILRQPTRRLARADLELLRSATLYVEDVYASWGFSEDFIRGCALLRDRVQTVLDQLPESPSTSNRRPSMTAGHGPATQEPAAAHLARTLQSEADGITIMGGNVNAEQPELDGREAATSNGYECLFSGQNNHHDRQHQALLDPLLQPFEGVQFEDIWSMVGSDFFVDHDHLVFAPL